MQSKSSLAPTKKSPQPKYPLSKTAFQSIKKDVNGVDRQFAELQKVSGAAKNELEKIKNDLDSLSEMGEMESLRLQMAMDRMSKMMSMLSNIFKKISDTQQSILQNLK